MSYYPENFRGLRFATKGSRDVESRSVTVPKSGKDLVNMDKNVSR
jgi:hypothetical protein